MLEEKQIEFKWAKIMLILESAADTGEIQAANAYKRAKTCQDKLREERSSRSLWVSSCSGDGHAAALDIGGDSAAFDADAVAAEEHAKMVVCGIGIATISLT